MLINLFYYIFKSRLRLNIFLFSYNKYKIIINYIYNSFKKYFFIILFKRDYIYLYLKENKFKKLFFLLKNNFLINCVQLLDIIIVDRLEIKLAKGKRFYYSYVLLSLINNIRIFVNGFIGLFDILPSLTSLFKSSDWLEREIWDMFGIFFFDHPNLRRILTDYGFTGFPLRKDFPLSGYTELRYDEITKSIVIEPLELMQEFRYLKLEIPWRN